MVSRTFDTFVDFNTVTGSLLGLAYSYQTSFGKKYDYFSLLCKQMDIYLKKVYIFRKVTSAPTFFI